jgi:hypothetical protein
VTMHPRDNGSHRGVRSTIVVRIILRISPTGVQETGCGVGCGTTVESRPLGHDRRQRV